MANDVCHFAWCKELKKDVYHVSICTNVKCKLCIIFRPLILIHSLQCTKLHCSIPFCEVLSLSFSLMISALSQCLGRVSHEHERLPRSRLSHSSLFISFLFSSFHHRLHIASTRFSLSLSSLTRSQLLSSPPNSPLSLLRPTGSGLSRDLLALNCPRATISPWSPRPPSSPPSPRSPTRVRLPNTRCRTVFALKVP